jgi:hypothetical protein
MSGVGPTHAAEKFLCPVRASAVERIGFLMVDPAHLETVMQVIADSDEAARV